MNKYGRQANVVVVLDPKNNVLVLRRGSTAPTYPGFWNLPGGYREDTDLTASSAALRELYEEAGIKVAQRDLNWAFSFRELMHLTNVFYVKLKRRPPVRLLDKENDKYIWVPFNKIPAKIVPNLRFILQQIGAGTNLLPVHVSQKAKKNSYTDTVYEYVEPYVKDYITPIFFDSVKGYITPMAIGGIVSLVAGQFLMTSIIKAYRPDLNFQQGGLTVLGWTVVGLVGASVPILLYLPAEYASYATPVLATATVGASAMGYATYKLFKKPKEYRRVLKNSSVARNISGKSWRSVG